MSKRIEIAEGVTVSAEVRTSITVDEFEKCQTLIPEGVEIVESNDKITLVQSFDDVKSKILSGFDKLSDTEVRTLALREYKTRDFQDTVRADLRATLGLGGTNSGSRELTKALKNDPEMLAELLKKYKINQ